MSLPTYTVTRFVMDDESGSYDMYKVECPRSKCKGEFWVRKANWVGAIGYPTRPCPYCFKVAKLPTRLLITKKKRITKR